jgi:hypothetical protein
MLVSLASSFINLGIFLRHWWVRRKRLNESWALGMRNGISQTEFRRLVVTVLSVILIYFPLSIYIFVLNMQRTLQVTTPFSWSTEHGPLSGLIIKEANSSAALASWTAPVIAITSFFFVGTTRNARQFYERCVEWLYDHSPRILKAKLSGMRKISESSKERRLAQSSLTGGTDARNNISMVETYSP